MCMKRFLATLACLVALHAGATAAPRHVIVIAMENKDAGKTAGNSRGYIYGNTKDAPYLNGPLAAGAARATNFADELSAYNSQPHYIAMEAGTNTFADTTFTCDNDPLKSCSYLLDAQHRASGHADRGRQAQLDDLSGRHRPEDDGHLSRSQRRSLCGQAQSLRLLRRCVRRAAIA